MMKFIDSFLSKLYAVSVIWPFPALRAACIGVLLGTAACQDSQPLQLLSSQLESSPTPKPASAPRQYERPPGVLFHVKGILGSPYTQFKGSEAETYLGTLVEEERLPGVRGWRYLYGQGELFVVRDRIYAAAYTFPEPIDALGALHACGLPEAMLTELRVTSTELKVERSAFGFRRFSLQRTAADSDRFHRMMAWLFLPTEKY